MRTNNTLKNFLKWQLVLVFLIGMMMPRISVAQTPLPTNYCEPNKSEPSWPLMYYYCYPAYYKVNYGYDPYYGSLIYNVEVKDASGAVKMSNTTSNTLYNKYNTVECFEFFNDPAKLIQVSPGETYTISFTCAHVYGYMSYTCTTYYFSARLFIDWTKDGDFKDANEWVNGPSGPNPTPMWRDYVASWGPAPSYSCSNMKTYSYQVKIPDNIEPGFTRIRFMTSYYYPYQVGPSTTYYDYDGINPCHNAMWYNYAEPPYNYGYGYKYSYGESEDYVMEFQIPVKDMFPSDKAPNDLLNAGVNYDGTGGKSKPWVSFYSAQAAGMQMQYSIKGPLPFDDVVYKALDPVTGTDWINLAGYTTYNMQKSTGTCSVNGNGTFRSDKGGEYVVTIVVRKPGTTDKTLIKTFTVSWPDDIAVYRIVSPRAAGTPDYFQYPRDNPIGLSVEYQNVGEYNVTKFKAIVEVYNPNGTLNTTFTKIYDVANGDPILKRRDKAIVTMDQSFSTSDVGFYRVVAYCQLLSSTDKEPYNDRFRRQGYEEYYLSVQYEFQAAAEEITFPKPASEVIAYRPFRPVGNIKNKGLNDISDVIAKYTYWKKSDPSVKKTVTTIVKEIPSGMNNNMKYAVFPSITINDVGDYHGVFTIDLPNDGYTADNITEGDFTVVAGLAGTYTIGTKNAGDPRNFNTIDLATNALFMRGLSGSVVMEFTDDNYDVYSPMLDRPAWDLSSAILGLGYDAQKDTYNTLIFRPSADKGAARNSVNINLYAQNGQGILFGSSSTNFNSNAIINQDIEWETKGLYVNNGGYITFDGGNNKSLNFKIYSNTNNHASVFYLGRGSHHITVKNCLINNATDATASKTFIPRISYNSADGFVFQGDVTTDISGTQGYSAGVVNRSIISNSANEKSWGVAPTVNHHNVIEGNEIKNFGYGVMSLGIGVAINSQNVFTKFFNNSNAIRNNSISRIAGAGVFVGFEDNSEVSYNKIYKVNGASDNFGILAGLARKGTNYGYNNTNLTIAGNQINEIKGIAKSAGIEVSQSQVTLANTDGSEFTLPNGTENLNINSNGVWDIRATSTATNRAGIYLTTERGASIDKPYVNSYFINGATVSNNTVVLDDDALDNIGAVACIAIQNTKKLTLANNALAQNDTKSLGLSNAAVLYQGFEARNNNNMVMDNNAYYVVNGAEIVRYIETNDQSEILELGYINEFVSLDQWKLWTGKDMTSSFGYNFVTDHLFLGYDPVTLAMKSNPSPKGSVLNNRGLRLSNITTDMYKAQRGPNDQYYDIGAIEFSGQPYIKDVEPFGIIKSGVKKNTAPMNFSDAYYEMIEPSINFQARVYNGGINTQLSVPVTLTITVQNPDGTFGAVLADTKTVNTLSPSSFADVDYLLNDGVGTDFKPKTYYEINKERAQAGLSQYSIPAQFAPMAANVTPIYRITVSTPLDENNNNNTKIYDFRYYVKRSPIELMTVSNSDLTPISATPTVDEIATKANYSQLTIALKDLGWYTDYNAGRFDIDYLYLAGWMPQAINYVPYTSVIWSDADYENTNTNLSIYQIDAFGKFLDKGAATNKKNLIIASQEIARLNRSGKGQVFLNNYMKLNNNYPSNPLGINGNYDQNTIKGVEIAKNFITTIAKTSITGDDYPKPALLMFKNETAGQTFIGHIYTKLEQGKNGENDTDPYPNSQRIMSVATSNLNYNTIYLGVDWRHYSNVAHVIRGLSDYIEYHGGNLLPVELLSFNAEVAGKRVDVSWTTATETNASKFEVEKANGSSNDFTVISEVPAKGNSVDEVKYGPVKDFNVDFGKTYTYRLKMTDKDGSVNYSDNRTVEVRGEVGFISLSEINPNPATIESKAELVLGNEMEVEITLYDMSGRMVQTLMSGTQSAGQHNIMINTKSLMSGTYTLILRAGDVVINKNFQVVK